MNTICHESSQTDEMSTCHISTQTDMWAQCRESVPTDVLYPCHATTTQTDLAVDDHSWLADESAAPPCDFLMCEKVVVRPGVTFFGTFNASLPSFPAGGSGAAGETDVGPGVPNAECRVDGSWTELCARETCLTTPKQQKRCVHKNNITRKRTDTAYDVCIILRVIDSYSLPVKSK